MAKRYSPFLHRLSTGLSTFWVLVILLWGIGGVRGQSWRPDIDPETGLWGYRDTANNWALAPGYHRAEPFAEGLAVVTLDERKYITDQGMALPGRQQIPGSYLWRPQHVIDTLGQVRWKIPLGYEVPEGSRYGSGLLPMRAFGGRYGFVDHQGQMRLPWQWTRAWCFAKGWAAVLVPTDQVDSLYRHLPRRLQERLTEELRIWRQGSQTKAARRERPYGGLQLWFIDSLGEVQEVLPVQYDIPDLTQPFRFEEGYLPVKAWPNGGMGLVDQAWWQVLPCRYEQLGLMQEGWAFAVNQPDVLLEGQVEQQGGDSLFVGYLNLAGQPMFSLSPAFLSGTCRYRVQGKPRTKGQAWIWLYPLYCDQWIGLRIGDNGELKEYIELPVGR